MFPYPGIVPFCAAAPLSTGTSAEGAQMSQREVEAAADARCPCRLLQGSDPVPRDGGDRGPALPPAANLPGARLHRGGGPSRPVRPRPPGHPMALVPPLHHRQPHGDRPPRRVRRDLPDVHDRHRAVVGAAADPAPPRLRPRLPAGGLLDAHPRRHPLRARRAPDRRGDRRDRAGPLLHGGGAAGAGRAAAAQHADRPRELRGAAVPGPRGGSRALRHRRARPGYGGRQGPRPGAGPRAGGGGPGADRRGRAPRPAPPVSAGRAHPLHRIVHGGLPPRHRRDGADGGGERPLDDAGRLRRRVAAGGNRIPPGDRGDDRPVQGPPPRGVLRLGGNEPRSGAADGLARCDPRPVAGPRAHQGRRGDDGRAGPRPLAGGVPGGRPPPRPGASSPSC
ncbi:hypothetical protein Lal_00044855 [Lupinus albus]|nr:hypothetical protein Lal_00044855 [Lupinus albus]